MSEIHVCLGDVLVMPNGERWWVVSDPGDLYWLSNHPPADPPKP